MSALYCYRALISGHVQFYMTHGVAEYYRNIELINFRSIETQHCFSIGLPQPAHGTFFNLSKQFLHKTLPFMTLYSVPKGARQSAHLKQLEWKILPSATMAFSLIGRPHSALPHLGSSAAAVPICLL
uniref:Uncharacterized protein n=1 Tax=Romanomermis culicivorax TaxID=13658 RepID=A0A915KTN3_ROMCU